MMMERNFSIQYGARALFRLNAGGEITEMRRAQRNVEGSGLADRLAIVERLDHGKMFRVFVDPVGNLIKDGGALLRRLLFPVFKRGPCGFFRVIYVLPGGLRADCERFAVGGAFGGEGGSVGGIFPHTVNKQTVLLLKVDIRHRHHFYLQNFIF